MSSPADLLILSNGPGELTTWVRPVLTALQQIQEYDPSNLRISLILSPCPNASGREVEIARHFPGLDRIQAADQFFPFLVWGKTAASWDWRDRGVVLFLGGDQIYPILIGKRLGYRIVIYGEWDTRWHRWGDRYGVMTPNLIRQAPPQYAHKFTVVGDLMADAALSPSPMPASPPISSPPSPPVPLLGFLPGSKPAKLSQGVPLTLAIAHRIHQQRPDIQFMIPVAPALDVATLARFAQAHTNPVLPKLGGIEATLVDTDSFPVLKIEKGPEIELYTDFPAYERLRQCQLCITTVGANTAELGALTVPMLVLLPTQELDAMKAWDGIPGLLANLPGVGRSIATVINRWFLRKKRLLAWPNIWAGEEIVPELVGELQPHDLTETVLAYLDCPEALEAMRDRLRRVRGQPGAARQLAQLVVEELEL